MGKAWNDFKRDFFSRTARPIAIWVSALDNEIRYITVECEVIVKARTDQCEEIPRGD